MTKKSKADQIRGLLHLSNAVIASRLKCGDAYVRAVRQRTSPNGMPRYTRADKKWSEIMIRKRRQWYRRDPEYRARRLEAHRLWYAKNRAAKNA